MLVDKKLYLLRMEEDALEEKYCRNCGARTVKNMTRSEAIEHLKNIAIYSFQDGYTDEARQALDMAIKALEEPERRKGKWERHYCEDGNPDGWQCDCCGEWFYFGDMKPNFCPDCGCRMEGESE